MKNEKFFMRRISVVILFLFIINAGMFAGGEGENGGSEKVIEIRHMSPHTAGSGLGEAMISHLERFHAENPNIKIIHDALPSSDLRTKITVEMASGNPPNTSWLVLSYAREFMKDDLLMDWAPVFEDPAHPEFKERFSDTILYFSQDNKGRVMMAPHQVHIDGLFCNTEIFDKYGWKIPETFDDFLALGPKAREKGIVLTVTGGKDIRFAWLAAALMARAAGVENTNKLTIGDKIGEWDNPSYGFPQAMEKFAEMVKAGVYPDGVLGISQNEADQMFVRGEAATYYEGQWRPGNWEVLGGKEFISKIRRVDFPVMTDMPMGDSKVRVGGTIVGLVAAANQSEAERQASIEWVKSLESPEYWIPVLEEGKNLYPGRIEYDKSKVSDVMLECAEALLNAEQLIPSMDCLAPPAIDLAIKKTAMPGIVSGQFTVEQAVAEVQKAAEQYLKAQEN